jgi:hypothetical protein
MYYFSNINFNSNIIKDNSTLQDAETITQSVVNNLKSQPITSSDTVIPKLTNETLDSLMEIESSVKTEPSVITTTDYNIQTDIKMLYDYMIELLYNNATPVTSLCEMEPETFADLLANDPQGPAYLEHIQNWVDNVPPIITSNAGSRSSEINFLRQVLESMKSNHNSPVELANASSIDLITQTNNNILIIIQRKIEYLHGVNLNIEQLSKILYYYESVLHESKLNDYIVYCTDMFGSQIFPLM